MTTTKLDFEALYQLYPRRIKGANMGKAGGLRKCKSMIKTDEQYQDLKSAIENYAKSRQDQDQQYTKQFEFFMTNWTDFIPSAAPPPKKIIVQESFCGKCDNSGTLIGEFANGQRIGLRCICTRGDKISSKISLYTSPTVAGVEVTFCDGTSFSNEYENWEKEIQISKPVQERGIDSGIARVRDAIRKGLRR